MNGENEDDYQDMLQLCFSYPKGLPSDSNLWVNKVKTWASELHNQLNLIDESLDNGAWRLILQLSRLSLMLGDHKYSSLPASNKWKNRYKDQKVSELYANTHKDPKTKKTLLNQRLDEHLVEVSNRSINNARLLPSFEKSFLPVYDIKSLKIRTTDSRYKWQDKAVRRIEMWKKKIPESKQDTRQGFFTVNMASTGCGKTFANPKIMQALSSDGNSMRYILALGLRTLTLQTGNEYRDKISPEDQTDIAVMIGSKSVMDLYNQNYKSQQQKALEEKEQQGSESAEELIENDTDYEIPEKELLNHPLAHVFPENNVLKNMRFLHPAILVCTIDYMMDATETKRGGKHILPTLRLMSSDLVIDEIDDFDGLDQVAIGRLIHLAGMLGRQVMISSASITPSLAEGYFNTYREGWKIFSKARNTSYSVGCAWIDEFDTQVNNIYDSETDNALEHYREIHSEFITQRVINIKKKEKKEGAKRLGKIILCKELHPSQGEVENKVVKYHEKIKDTIINNHLEHHTFDSKTNKKVSFGVVRVANIEPCIELAEYLIDSEWDSRFDVKIMAYHSRQIQLLRHMQEVHLDAVLTRKEKIGERPKAFNEIHNHLENSSAQHIIFILVATPVEEVGRDHDFDWAVIEPSSFRSIIQLSGRVLRHRSKVPTHSNVALMQYNLNSIKRGDEIAAYLKPGYETQQPMFKLKQHDLTTLVEESLIQKSINAIPRIQIPQQLKPREQLADLEHFSISKYLTNYKYRTAASMQGWIDHCWWLTGIPQSLVKFRNSQPTTKLYRLPSIDDDEIYEFQELTPNGKRTLTVFSITDDNSETSSRLWLKRDYADSLSAIAKEKNISKFVAALRYGEISVNTNSSNKQFIYSDQFGLKKVKE